MLHYLFSKNRLFGFLRKYFIKHLANLCVDFLDRLVARDSLDLILLFKCLNDGVTSVLEHSESFLDGLNVIINATRALSTFQQSLKHDFLWALKIKNEFGWYNLACIVNIDEPQKSNTHFLLTTSSNLIAWSIFRGKPSIKKRVVFEVCMASFMAFSKSVMVTSIGTINPSRM